MVNIAVLGYGVVGSGVVEVLKTNRISIKERAGKEISVKKILDIRNFEDSPDKHLITSNPDEVFNDESISIVVETIGGTKIAYEYTKRALSLGKSVVTSNKELVATHGPELLKLAAEKGVRYLFEASVGGGIPIIRPLSQCLAANELNGIIGILNGTTNYILTQMKNTGKGFNEALKEAQMKGYAEANPSADIEGHDACRKIAILSSIAFNQYVDCRNIYTEGISSISLEDMQYADAMDSVIKLVGIGKKIENKVFARVSPVILSKQHPLANVEDVFNAILVSGNAIGDVMFYGRGAGKLPTASAVVADIIDIVKHAGSAAANTWEVKDYDNLVNKDEIETSFFVRLIADQDQKEKVCSNISEIFGDVKFIMLQEKKFSEEIAFVTSEEKEGKLHEKISILKDNKSVKDILKLIRVEGN